MAPHLALWYSAFEGCNRRCGSAEGLDAGRHCLKKWGFRRCEDICWIKTNKEAGRKAAVRQDANSVLQHTKVGGTSAAICF